MVDLEVDRLAKLAYSGDRGEVATSLHGLARHGVRRLADVNGSQSAAR
jgi:hypothetical protein